MTAKASVALCLLCVFGFTAAPLIASDQADENATTTAVEADEVVLPEREIEFEVSEEPYSLPFSVDQGHVAVVDFAAQPDNSALRRLSVDLRSRFMDHWGLLLGGAGRFVAPHEFFQSLIADLPDPQMLREEDISFFTDEHTFERRHILYIQRDDRGRPRVHILAPTAEAARQRAEAYLKLVDFGITLPAQQDLREEQRRLETEAVAKEREIAEIDQAIEEIQQQLQDTEAMRPEELSALRNEQRLLAVELAGTEARITAAAELLKKRPLPGNRIEQIETLKVAAEIELAGLSARKALLDEIVGGGQQRRELENRLRISQRDKSSHEREFQQLRREIDRYEEAIDGVALPINENKVVIHPIE